MPASSISESYERILVTFDIDWIILNFVELIRLSVVRIGQI
jgi:hypothetical protein